MIQLTAIEKVSGNCLSFRFSDGAFGVFDFKPLIDANTEMTAPLADPVFFKSYYIELGTLAWPNGFDLSASSLHSQLEEAGLLQRSAEVA